MAKTKPINWDKQIKKLTKYSDNIGYKVLIKKIKNQGISYINFENKEIVIHSGTTKERQLYTILHELGHYIILFEKAKKYKKTLGFQMEKFSKNSLVHKTAILEEEIEAWKLGFKLVKKLGIKINRHNFEIFKSSLLATYIAQYNNYNNKDTNGKRKI